MCQKYLNYYHSKHNSLGGCLDWSCCSNRLVFLTPRHKLWDLCNRWKHLSQLITHQNECECHKGLCSFGMHNCQLTPNPDCKQNQLWSYSGLVHYKRDAKKHRFESCPNWLKRTCGRVVKGNGLQNHTIVGSNPTRCSEIWRLWCNGRHSRVDLSGVINWQWISQWKFESFRLRKKVLWKTLKRGEMVDTADEIKMLTVYVS